MFDEEIYYYSGSQQVRLFPDPQIVVVRLGSNAPSEQIRRLLEKTQSVNFLPRDGLHVYRIESGLKFIEALHQVAGVAMALPAFRRAPESEAMVFVTARLLAQFRPELGSEKIGALLERFNLRILEPLPYASPNGFLLESAPGMDGLGALTAANTLVEERLVVFAEPDLIQSRQWRDGTPPDPTNGAFLDRQWHLKATGVLEAWNDTQGSSFIRIAILDDGLDLQHPEFNAVVNSGQPKVADQFDFATGTADASPKTYIDNHGTACAGVAAAAGVKAAGVAPGCRLIIARLPQYLGISDEAKMFQWAADRGADVISCSWGPEDGTGAVFPLPTPTKLAIRYCLNNGRAGKGIPIFWAAGNGSESISADGYASNPDVMAIAACTAAEAAALYSDFGPEIFACAPSNGVVGQPAIFTTDRRGSVGYNPGNGLRGDAEGDYTNSFGGTSAAAPLAAGIAALALSANPNLTAAQVRDLLRRTADRIGAASAYDGKGHSDRLGYGRLNAARAVADAHQTGAGQQPDGPTIVGPDSWSRVDAPPLFQVDSRPYANYVFEGCARPELFDMANHGSERGPDNFYGSWSDSPFQTNPTYTLPASAWEHLRLSDRLWYRVGVSASPAGYVDYLVSTPDNQGEVAPSILVTPGVGRPLPSAGAGRRTISELAEPESGSRDQPRIEGPLRWDRRLDPPTFRLEPGKAAGLEIAAVGLAYAVEVAADPKCFDAATVPSELEKENYFHSGWLKSTDESGAPQVGFLAYNLPPESWAALLRAPRLYYRLVVRSAEIKVSRVSDMELVGAAQPPMNEGGAITRPEEAVWSLQKNAVQR